VVKILTINTLGYSQNNLHTYNSTDVTTHYYCSSWTYKFTPWASFWASYWVFSSCNSTILQQLPFVKGSRFDLKYWLNSSIVCFWWTVLPTSIKEKRVQVEKDQIIVDFDDSFCQDAAARRLTRKSCHQRLIATSHVSNNHHHCHYYQVWPDG